MSFVPWSSCSHVALWQTGGNLDFSAFCSWLPRASRPRARLATLTTLLGQACPGQRVLSVEHCSWHPPAGHKHCRCSSLCIKSGWSRGCQHGPALALPLEPHRAAATEPRLADFQVHGLLGLSQHTLWFDPGTLSCSVSPVAAHAGDLLSQAPQGPADALLWDWSPLFPGWSFLETETIAPRSR